MARLCQVLPIKHVAAFFGLGWDAVKAIDKRHLMDTLGAIDLSGVSILAMDEFAIHKGHRYATVIIDPTIKKVLWVGRGRGREDIRPFFELLGSAGRDRIKAVAMDMNGAYEAEVRAQCPDAEIVFDLFHVVAKFGREVVNRVRVDEANRLADDKPARKVVKSARWLLLRNRDNIKRQQDLIRLDELLAANHALMTVYVLKEDLSRGCGNSEPKARQRRPGKAGSAAPSRAPSNPSSPSPGNSKPISPASSPTPPGPSTPACSKASTTRSKSSREWPTDSATTNTSSSKSEPLSPELPDEPKVFRPFVQLNASANKRYPGTGLGLPIAKSLVELHGGSLTLESRREGGTTATIYLPAARVLGPEAVVH